MKPDKEKPVPKKPGGKVFDVRRPGKAPASPTSRPVILGHKPEAQEAQVAVSGIGEARPLMNKRKIEIMPIGAVATEVSVQPTTSQTGTTPEVVPPKPDKDALASVVPDTVTDSQGRPTDGLPSPASSTEQKVEALDTSDLGATTQVEAATQKAEPELTPEERQTETTSVPEEPTPIEGQTAQLEEEPAPEPAIEPLFDDSGIVVSNHDHHHRHHSLKVLGLLLLIILLAAVAVNVLLDLNLLTLEGIPHTDFL